MTWQSEKCGKSDQFSVPPFIKCIYTLNYLKIAVLRETLATQVPFKGQRICKNPDLYDLTKALAQRNERRENGSYLGCLPLPVPPCSSAESVLLVTTPASQTNREGRRERQGEKVCVHMREWGGMSRHSKPPAFQIPPLLLPCFPPSLILDFPNR